VQYDNVHLCSCQGFGPLKCVNWNLGASHLPKFAGSEGKESMGVKGANLIACFLHLLHLPSFIHSVVRMLPTRSAAKNGGGYYNNAVNTGTLTMNAI
jgi:hypothetical protein